MLNPPSGNRRSAIADSSSARWGGRPAAGLGSGLGLGFGLGLVGLGRVGVGGPDSKERAGERGAPSSGGVRSGHGSGSGSRSEGAGSGLRVRTLGFPRAARLPGAGAGAGAGLASGLGLEALGLGLGMGLGAGLGGALGLGGREPGRGAGAREEEGVRRVVPTTSSAGSTSWCLRGPWAGAGARTGRARVVLSHSCSSRRESISLIADHSCTAFSTARVVAGAVRTW